MKHVVIDRTTGKVIKEEPMPADIDPAEFLRQQIHDCPECRAALERGEVPTYGTPLDLLQALDALEARGRTQMPTRTRPSFMTRRPRWRTVKRRRA